MAIGELHPFFPHPPGYDTEVSWYGGGLSRAFRRCSSGTVRNRHPDAEGRLDRCPGAYIRCIAPGVERPGHRQLHRFGPYAVLPLEDVYSLKVVEADGRACLQADIFQGGRQASELNKILIAWREQAAKLEAGEITKEDYDRWRYNYPKYDTTQRWAKVPSKELSDALIKGLKKQRKDK